MKDAPITSGERLSWMAESCEQFEFHLVRDSYAISAHKNGNYFESAGPACDMHEAINDAFYEVLQRGGDG